jgi:hypothetical protein
VHFPAGIFTTMKSMGMRREWHAARMDEKRRAYRVLIGKSEGKRPI